MDLTQTGAFTTREAAREVGERYFEQWRHRGLGRQRGIDVHYIDAAGDRQVVRAGELRWRERLLDALRWSGSTWGLVR